MNYIKRIISECKIYGVTLSEKEVKELSIKIFYLIVHSANGDNGISPTRLSHLLDNIIGNETKLTEFILNGGFDL